MTKLKSELHHWWPVGVSCHWSADDGKTGWLKPDGSMIRVPPARLGAIGNGHHIKLGRNNESSPWDQSFERAFDRADNSFPALIRWLHHLKRRPMHDVEELRQRFVTQECTDAELSRMTECAVSLAVRSPMNREASVAAVENIRGRIDASERNALIGLNIRNSQRVVADSIGSRAKFVVIYSQTREFVFGDGFFHSGCNTKMAPHGPKILVPLTPNINILVCKPSRYMVEPRLSTLVLDDHEVDILNHAVQVYSKNAIFFRSDQPALSEAFKRAAHLVYEHPGNPIDSLIHSIPGVPARDESLDRIFFPA